MNYKNLFPIFADENLHYLDTAATSQKPLSVIAKVDEYYKKHNGNPGRGSHTLSVGAELLVEDVRKKVSAFIGAEHTEEIIFTKNATEALNLLAYSYGLANIKEGDEILLGISNHHANIVPWQEVAKRTGAVLKYIYLQENGDLDYADYQEKLNAKTKIVSISMTVNVTGVIQDFSKILQYAREKSDAKVIFDASQSISHFKHTVKEWDVDFLVFSGHKMFAGMGVGILYGKKECLEGMPPFLCGGDMIDFVEEQNTEFAPLPHKFEAGTKDVASIASLGAAIDFIDDISYEKIQEHESKLLAYAYEKLKRIPEVEIYHHNGVHKAGILAFNIRGVHSHDTAYILDTFGVMVRSGHHCAQPLMKYLGIASCCRASFSLYNDEKDIDSLVLGIEKVKEVFLK